MEQKVKALLGEYAFTVAALQVQIEKLQKELEEANKEIDACYVLQGLDDENKSKRSESN